MAFLLFPWGQVGKKKKAKPEWFAYPGLGTLVPAEQQSKREILYCSYIAPKDTLVLLKIHLLATQTEEST